MEKEKARLDLTLVERGLAESRQRAQALITAGLVRVDGERVDKASLLVGPEARLEVEGTDCPFVSRGGLKLARALAVFPVAVAGRVVLDVGASTGGFTDCLLQHGARLVYAVDVGYGQLAWKLRQDKRVVLRERTNIRRVQGEEFDPRPELATIDVSFISLRLVLPVVARLLIPPAEVVSLIKPQFEAGRAQVGKKGVVREPAVHRRVLTELAAAAAAEGYALAGLTYSPVKGPEGNIEFLAWWVPAARGVTPVTEEEQAQVVAAAWKELK